MPACGQPSRAVVVLRGAAPVHFAPAFADRSMKVGAEPTEHACARDVDTVRGWLVWLIGAADSAGH